MSVHNYHFSRGGIKNQLSTIKNNDDDDTLRTAITLYIFFQIYFFVSPSLKFYKAGINIIIPPKKQKKKERKRKPRLREPNTTLII